MNSQRRSPRKRPSQTIEIYNRLSGQIVGQLANLTPEGLMLIGPDELQPGTLFQLQMPLPEPTHGAEAIDFGVESLWHKQAGNSHQYWTGFHIIDISQESTQLIKLMIEDWDEV